MTLLFLAVAVTGFAGMAGLALYTYRALNLVFAASSIDLGKAAIAEVERSLAREALAHGRAEAAGKLLGPDLGRSRGKLARGLDQSPGIDAVVSIDRGGKIVAVSVGGEPRSPERFPELAQGLAKLIEGEPGPARGFVRIGEDVHFVAASPVAPQKGLASRGPEAPSVLFVARKISPGLLADLARRYPLRNLRLVAREPAPPAPFLRIAAPDGAIIGALAWDAERPGDEMLRTLAPGGGVLAMLLAAATVLFLRDARAALAERSRAVRTVGALTTELATVEERERRRFAAYLHDQIGQALALLQMKCGALAAAAGARPLRPSIAEIRDLLERVIEDTHSLILDLSPPVLYELGLGPAVEQIGEQLCAAHGLGFEFADDGRAKPLDADLAARLFRSVRELLVNVVRHARARHVRVTLARAGDELHIGVEDDGVGFDAVRSEPRAGTEFGLFSVRERLRPVGGRLEIESRPGRTRAVLVVPLPPRETADEEIT